MPPESGSRAAASPTSAEAATKAISFHGVQLIIPAGWPVVDGAHARYTCGSGFAGQSDRAFLGDSYLGVPSCPFSPARPPSADGVWMQPSGAAGSDLKLTVLPSGQRVYASNARKTASTRIWYHHVFIEIGIGADPAVERRILDSISYHAGAAGTAVLGRCPRPDPTPPAMPAMPAASRASDPVVLEGDNGTLRPEPAKVRPRATARSVWTSLFRGFGGFSGAHRWSITFGSYSAATPGTINPDGSTTPDYHDTPTWLIRGEPVMTSYGACGSIVIAPYNANTGRSTSVTTIG